MTGETEVADEVDVALTTGKRGSDRPPAGLTWVDAHCHLQGDYLKDAGDAATLDGLLARAAGEGVTRMVCVGTSAETSSQAIDLARCYDGIVLGQPGAEVPVGLRATAGVHPHEAGDGFGALASMVAAQRDGGVRPLPAVAGIGECGLDYHYDHAPRRQQQEVFAAQVGLALEASLPLVIHTRDAWDDTFAVLAGVGTPRWTVFHCFTGGPREAERCLGIGAVLSFSGIVTFKNADDVRAAAALCPLDSLLVETDSPYLAPVPVRGTTNEPSRIPLIGAAVAATKGIAVEDVASATTRNACAIFGF